MNKEELFKALQNAKTNDDLFDTAESTQRLIESEDLNEQEICSIRDFWFKRPNLRATSFFMHMLPCKFANVLIADHCAREQCNKFREQFRSAKSAGIFVSPLNTSHLQFFVALHSAEQLSKFSFEIFAKDISGNKVMDSLEKALALKNATPQSLIDFVSNMVE